MTEYLPIPAPSSNLISPKRVIFEPTNKQATFVQAVFSNRYRYLLYGGGIRGGKTFVLIAIFLLLARLFPRSRWVIVRADNQVLQRNVIPPFFKLCPPKFLEDYNKTTHTAVFKNGSELIFFSEQFEDDPELTRWHGFEMNGVGLEEADELQEKTFDKSIERVGSWIIDPMPPMLVLLTCNPNAGYLKKRFYEPFKRNELKAPYYFLEAKIDDNPYIPEEFKRKLKDMPPELYKRFVEGSWEQEDAGNQLIPWLHIHRASTYITLEKYIENGVKKINKTKQLDIDLKELLLTRKLDLAELSQLNLKYEKLIFEETTKRKIAFKIRSMGVDVGGQGKDPSVWTIMEGPNILHQEEIAKTDTPDVVEKTKLLIIEYNINPELVGIDIVGLGAGVVPYLHQERFFCVGLIGGAVPEELFEESGLTLFQFVNLRAQMAWILKDDFENENIGNVISQDLKDDISADRYKTVSEKKIQLLSKDDIKKILGRSPDKGDSLKYANWMRRKAELTSMPGIVFG